MALFLRNDFIGKPLNTNLNRQSLPISDVKYKKIPIEEFPYKRVERSRDEKICCKVQCFTNEHSYHGQH